MESDEVRSNNIPHGEKIADIKVPSDRSHSVVLANVSHGETLPAPVALDRVSRAVLLEPVAVQGGPPVSPLLAAAEVTFETPFDYLFDSLKTDPAAHLPAANPAAVVGALIALGDEMVEASAAVEPDPTNNSNIPPVYTYWGQFIDHDLTANTDRGDDLSDVTNPNLAPRDPDEVVLNLKNLRQPQLNLDNLYGDGPSLDPSQPTRAADFYDGIKFKVGTVSEDPRIQGDHIPPVTDLQRDLPRQNQTAQIADARNDENLIVAQLHTAFLRFHNNVVDHVSAEATAAGTNLDEQQIFDQAQALTQWHYQWLVVNDFLRTVTLAGVVDKVLLDGPKFYAPRDGAPYMPLEFSVAAFRFGHTMVRAAYDHNRNFGKEHIVISSAPFILLFKFTGKASPAFPIPGVVPAATTPTLPFNWVIEWDRFTDKGSSDPAHFTRKIDTLLAPPLRDLTNEGNRTNEGKPTPPGLVKDILKRLARRNLLRGYMLSLPTGQSVADALGVPQLTAAELHQGNTAAMNTILDNNGFIQQTPLWYYILKESEVRANGNSLGAVGSRIVCETIIGQLVNDPASYLQQDGGWDPSQGVRLPSASGNPDDPGDLIVTIRDFIRFAGIPA